DLDDEARLAAPPDASGALPERGLRARVADEDGDVERADVDPELERVRRDDDLDVPGPQPGLDLAPQVRQVAAPVAAALRRRAPHRRRARLQVARQDLDRGAPAAEEDRLAAAAADEGRELARLLERVRPQAGGRVQDRRVVDAEDARARGRGVLVDDE